MKENFLLKTSIINASFLWWVWKLIIAKNKSYTETVWDCGRVWEYTSGRCLCGQSSPRSVAGANRPTFWLKSSSMAGQSGDCLSHSLSDWELLEGGHHLTTVTMVTKKSRALTSLGAILTKDIFIINQYLQIFAYYILMSFNKTLLFNFWHLFVFTCILPK